MTITIDGRRIGHDQPPYMVAEISCNHGGKLEEALSLIRVAKYSGASAVKFQCYEADTITLDHDSPDFIVKDGPWKSRNLHALYEKTQTPFAWFPRLFEEAKKTGITIFASVFDRSSVDLLEGLGCPAYKIASMEITDTPLIKYAASTGKPIIISTGMASSEERGAAAELLTPGKCAFLVCVSDYPARVEDFSLYDLKFVGGSKTGVVGISDHTIGNTIPIAATALGASIIEKHLMLGNIRTEDFNFSMMPAQFRLMVEAVNEIWQAMQPPKENTDSSSRQMRRSLYVVRDMLEDEAFTEQNVRSIRPAYGLAPGMLEWLISGRKAARPLKKGTPLSLSDIVPSP